MEKALEIEKDVCLYFFIARKFHCLLIYLPLLPFICNTVFSLFKIWRVIIYMQIVEVTCLVRYSNSVVDVLSCFAKVCFTFFCCYCEVVAGDAF